MTNDFSRVPEFSKILDELCARPAGRGPYTNTELVKRVERTGGMITDGYISHLRRGLRDNPTLQTMQDLAAALNVSPAVFAGGRRMRVGAENPRASFSRKLRHLFDAIHPPDRGPYSPEEVAASINDTERFGTISPGHIRDLLAADGDEPPNPRLRHIQGLAHHFGLADDGGAQAAYFLDDRLAETIDAELADIIALRDAGVMEFAARLAQDAPGWTPELRRRAVQAVTVAVESGETSWVFGGEGGHDG